MKFAGPADWERLLVEQVSGYAIFRLTDAGIVSSWNPGAERIKGYAAAEIIGQHFSILYPAEDREAGVPMPSCRRRESMGTVKQKDGGYAGTDRASGRAL